MLSKELCILKANASESNEKEELFKENLDNRSNANELVTDPEALRAVAESFSEQTIRLFKNLIDWPEWFCSIVSNPENLADVADIFPEYKKELFERYLSNQEEVLRSIVDTKDLSSLVDGFYDQKNILFRRLIDWPEWLFGLGRHTKDWQNLVRLFPDKQEVLFETCLKRFCCESKPTKHQLKIMKVAFPDQNKRLVGFLFDWPGRFIVNNVNDLLHVVNIFTDDEERLFKKHLNDPSFTEHSVTNIDDVRTLVKESSVREKLLFETLCNSRKWFFMLVKNIKEFIDIVDIFTAKKKKLFNQYLVTSGPKYISTILDLKLAKKTFSRQKNDLFDSIVDWPEWFALLTSNIDDLDEVEKLFHDRKKDLLKRYLAAAHSIGRPIGSLDDLKRLATIFHDQKDVLLQRLLDHTVEFYYLVKDIESLHTITEIFNSSEQIKKLFARYIETLDFMKHYVNSANGLSSVAALFPDHNSRLFTSLVNCSDYFHSIVGSALDLKTVSKTFSRKRSSTFNFFIGDLESAKKTVKNPSDLASVKKSFPRKSKTLFDMTCEQNMWFSTLVTSLEDLGSVLSIFPGKKLELLEMLCNQKELFYKLVQDVSELECAVELFSEHKDKLFVMLYCSLKQFTIVKSFKDLVAVIELFTEEAKALRDACLDDMEIFMHFIPTPSDLWYAINSLPCEKERLFKNIFSSNNTFFNLVKDLEGVRTMKELFPDKEKDLLKAMIKQDSFPFFVTTFNKLLIMANMFQKHQKKLFKQVICNPAKFSDFVSSNKADRGMIVSVFHDYRFSVGFFWDLIEAYNEKKAKVIPSLRADIIDAIERKKITRDTRTLMVNFVHEFYDSIEDDDSYIHKQLTRLYMELFEKHHDSSVDGSNALTEDLRKQTKGVKETEASYAQDKQARRNMKFCGYEMRQMAKPLRSTIHGEFFPGGEKDVAEDRDRDRATTTPLPKTFSEPFVLTGSPKGKRRGSVDDTALPSKSISDSTWVSPRKSKFGLMKHGFWSSSSDKIERKKKKEQKKEAKIQIGHNRSEL